MIKPKILKIKIRIRKALKLLLQASYIDISGNQCIVQKEHRATKIFKKKKRTIMPLMNKLLHLGLRYSY